MAKLKPGGGDGGETREPHRAIPAGRYPLGLVWFTRKQSKTGNDFLRCKLEVCGGPLKGRAAYVMMSCDLSRDGTVKRWEILMESCGVNEEFELGSNREGTTKAGDANIRRLFVGKPFVAEIKRERNGDYEGNDLESLVFKKRWTPDEVEMMAEWAHEFQAEREKRRQSNPEDGVGGPPGDYDRSPPLENGGDRFDSFEDAGQYEDTEFDASGPIDPDEPGF